MTLSSCSCRSSNPLAAHLPAGMLLVVGGCWAGMPPEANRTTDLLATVTDSADDMQLFWEVRAGVGAVHALLFIHLSACHWHGA